MHHTLSPGDNPLYKATQSGKKGHITDSFPALHFVLALSRRSEVRLLTNVESVENGLLRLFFFTTSPSRSLLDILDTFSITITIWSDMFYIMIFKPCLQYVFLQLLSELKVWCMYSMFLVPLSLPSLASALKWMNMLEVSFPSDFLSFHHLSLPDSLIAVDSFALLE